MLPLLLVLLPMARAEEPAPTAAPAEAAPSVEPAPLPVAPPEPEPTPVPDPRVDLLERQLAEQQLALQDLQNQVATQAAKPPSDLKFHLEGHIRERLYSFSHLYASQTDAKGDATAARFIQHRVIARPVLEYKDLSKAVIEVRALDGVVWGDNAGNSSTPLFADTPSTTGIDGRELASIRLERAWVEARLPIGLLRFGRQPSDWGMGLLVNPGDRFDDDFGEDKFGSTNDRLLFATRPVAIAQKILDHEDTSFPLIVAVAVDRLVEDPLPQYYGYTCAAGVLQGDPAYDPRCDFDGDGVTDLDHGYDADRIEDQRGADWWADQADDVGQTLFVLRYGGDDLPWLDGGKGDLAAGTYLVHRAQEETDSGVWVIDLYAKLDAWHFRFEAEGVMISGDTAAIALPGSINTDPNADPLQKTSGIKGYVARLGYGGERARIQLENGYASGDENVADADFTGRPLSPDHNAGLLIYEEILARITSALWTDSARGLWSNGGVYNSMYVLPTVRVFPVEDLVVLAGFMTAYPDAPDGAIIRCSPDDKVGCASAPTQQATAATIGWEVDGAVKYTYNDHLLLSVEAGYAKTTDRLPLEAAGLDPAGKFFTLQSRVAWQF